MLPVEMAAPAYRCELPNGLVKRWSTERDTHNIADFFSTIFQPIFTNWTKSELMEYVYQHMRVASFVGGPDTVALIEDPHKSGNPVVATFALWRQNCQYADQELPVGRPEWCGTDPAYRGQHFYCPLVEMIHARSEARGDVALIFTGLPNRWRHIGYEYCLELSGQRSIHLARIPRIGDLSSEPYQLRPATVDDIPTIVLLYQRRRGELLVRTAIPEAYWHFYIEGASAPGEPPKRMSIQMIIDRARQVCGYLLLASTRRGQDLCVYSLEVTPETDWYTLVFPLLRALEHYGAAMPVNQPGLDAFSEISFYLDREHPLFTVVGTRMLSTDIPPHAWYVRVPDPASFIQHIRPVLEQRLRDSLFAGYRGTLRLSFYRQGLRMTLDRGHLVGVEAEHEPTSFHPMSASFPPEIFWKLLFGYRSLAELCHMYPDILVMPAARALLETLFPARPSWGMVLA